MRNLHVIASVDPATGGPVEGVIQLNRVLEAQGHSAEVACIDPPDSAFLRDFPLKVHAFGPGKGSYAYAPKLLAWLKENASKYDAVIVDGLWQYNSFAVWKALKGTSTPYFVFSHGMLDPWFNQAYPLKKLKKNLYWRWGMYGVLRDANAVLFTCEEEKILAAQSFRPYKVNGVVVKYGTPGPTGDLDRQREAFRSAFPELKDKRVLLYLSRIHEKKGCDILIEAFAKIAPLDPDLRLAMVGPGQASLISSLQQLSESLGVGDKVVWPGMLSGDLKWGAFAAAEAFVLSSHQENFGIVVAEALACSTPVLISNKVNIWREIERDSGGLVADDTLEATTKMLEKWNAMGEANRIAMKVTARSCFEKNFEITTAAESLVSAIRANSDVKS